MKNRADSFLLSFCVDPNCGLHLHARSDDGDEMEIVMSAEQTLEMIGICQRHLYEKATKKER